MFALDVAVDDDGRTTVAASGEMDLTTADEFADAVRTGLATGPVLVDLGDLTFMDSAGVRALNSCLREAAERGHELRVAGDLQANVVQVLELTGMMGLLSIEGRR